ncbi:spore germination protein [Paenibacillus cremeus]|nr:spore germination protein [Paenibacillus cremeus]
MEFITNRSKDSLPLSHQLTDNLELLKQVYANCSDVVFRSFSIGHQTAAAVVYIDGLVDTQLLDMHVLGPLMKGPPEGESILDEYISSSLSVSSLHHVEHVQGVIEHVSDGHPVLLIDRLEYGYSFGMSRWEKRSIEEPAAESIIRGPREGFTETIGVNTSLLRRKIKSPALKMISMEVGSYTRTHVIVTYIEGLAKPSLIEEVQRRIARIRIDGVLESGNIEEMLEDQPYSPFPQVKSTERPDVVSASLLEGNAAILVEGTPFALIAPTTFFSLFQSPEDYYQRYMISTFIRWLRYLFLAIALLLPSAYIAILTYHQEMIPTSLLLSIAKSRENIPFPALVEALLMEISFEALREAGVRLPKQVGAAVSIVGALVIGQAATSAGLASSPMVMVVAITGIASFMLPQYSFGIAIRMLRFPIMLLSGFLGLLGIILGVIVLTLHLCSLKSFGVPYMSPISPSRKDGLKDVLYRAPIWAMTTRSVFANENNEDRQPPDNGQTSA